MKLSICAIFHNQIEYVDRCLASILAQNISYDYEILLGDDYSSDGTWEKINEYQERYPDLISCYRINTDDFNPNSKNHRSGLNRSNVYDRIKGQYFSFIDGDDFFLDSGRFDQQIRTLDDFPNCTICAGNTDIYNDGNPPVFVKHLTEEGTLKNGTVLSGQEYLNSGFLHNSSMLIRKLSFNIFSNFRREMFEDYALTLYHLQYGSLVYIDKPFLAYIQQPLGIYTSLSEFEKHARSVCAIQDQLIYLPKFRAHHLRSLENTLQFLFYYAGSRALTPEGKNLIYSFSEKLHKRIIERKDFANGVCLGFVMQALVFIKRVLRKTLGIEPLVLVRGFINLRTYAVK